MPSLRRFEGPTGVHTTSHPQGANSNTRSLPEVEGVDLKLVSRVIRHIIADENDEADPRSKAFSQGSARIFGYICDILRISRVGNREGDITEKRSLFNKILEAVCCLAYKC